jgi:flagellar FliL protein
MKAAKASKLEQIKATLPLEPFLVNLADTDASRFVKTTFQLGLAEELRGEADSSVSIPAIRDSIITLLSSKTAEQILTSQGKDKLRDEIRSRINALSPNIKVVEVFIVDFVVQL